MTDDVVDAMARAFWSATTGQEPINWAWVQDAFKAQWRYRTRVAIRALHERGGLVVARMPADIEALTSAGHAYNMALAKVRAAAVEVEG